MRTIVVMIAAATLGCATPAPIPTGPSCAEACTNLARLGCPEGIDTTCTATCESVQAARLTDLRPACLAAAADAVAARACGSVTCRME